MENSFIVLQKSVAGVIWVVFLAVSAAPIQADVNWHTNFVSPGAEAVQSVPRFTDASGLKRVGYGIIKVVTPQHTTSRGAWWTIPAFMQKKEDLKEKNLYFQDPQTNCLAKIDLDSPVFNRRSISFELVHESSSDCREIGLLGRVNLVEINPCKAELCKRSDNDLFLFFGPEENDGVTFSDVMFYGGEFEIELDPKPWRISTKILQATDLQWSNRTGIYTNN
ncbi:MAG: hypothetical protein NXH95_21530 [Pseudomonadaceae bacterium]|nr:hypothetical protein [Pseudomonadaceae bacterium]